MTFRLMYGYPVLPRTSRLTPPNQVHTHGLRLEPVLSKSLPKIARAIILHGAFRSPSLLSPPPTSSPPCRLFCPLPVSAPDRASRSLRSSLIPALAQPASLSPPSSAS